MQDCTFSACQHSRLVPFTGLYNVYLGIWGTFRLETSADYNFNIGSFSQFMLAKENNHLPDWSLYTVVSEQWTT